jgi:cell division septum initiation protein DivIVA
LLLSEVQQQAEEIRELKQQAAELNSVKEELRAALRQIQPKN